MSPSSRLLIVKRFSSAQLDDLLSLRQVALEQDGGAPSFYPHLLITERRASNFLWYNDHHQLIACLCVFFFFAQADEVCLLVHPAYRRQGIATRLLHEALPLCELPCLYFSRSAALPADWLYALGFTFHHGESRLLRETFNAPPPPPSPLEVRLGQLKDIPTLCTLTQACFPKADPDPELDSYLKTLLTPPSSYTFFVACLNHQVIGMVRLRQETDSIFLSDLAIAPTHQHQGFGACLLRHAIYHVHTHTQQPIILEVETDNESAISLYTHHHFQLQEKPTYFKSIA